VMSDLIVVTSFADKVFLSNCTSEPSKGMFKYDARDL
jgi:hypothetical protein